MSTGQNSKSASKSDKKSKRKSLGDGSLPSTESDAVKAKADAVRPKKKKEKSKGEAVEEVKKGEEHMSKLAPTLSSASTQLPASTSDKTKTKEKVTKEVEQPKEPALSTFSKPEKKKKKTKGEAAKDTKKLEEPPVSGSAELLKPEKKKVKGEAMKEVKKLEDSASPPTPPVPAAEKQKKEKTKSGDSENIDDPTKPATNSTLPSIPKSISATSKASAPSKPSKASDKAFQKSKKNKAKEPFPSPSVSSAPGSEKVEAAAADDSEEEDEEDLHLHGFSTDDDDSSDEDVDMDYEAPAFDISKLPTIAKDDATVKRKLEKAKRQPTEDRGVVYIGRIPHGFYEDQMRGYFSQFGNVTRVRLSRNKKSGRSKHYGFVEFDSSSVAQIVAETMDNYLLTGHILRCKVIPKDEVHPELWVGANRKWRVVPRDRITRVQHNKSRTEDERTRTAKRLIKRQNERKRKLAEAGIKYDFEAVSYKKMKEA